MPSDEPSPQTVLTGLVQPDARSCGAASLVAADALADPAYAAALRADPARWRADVLRTHAEVTGLRDQGAASVPWPRALGTPPWAVARRLAARRGGSWTTRWRPDVASVAAHGDHPAAVYVGSTLLPRHVLLAVATTGDPASAVVYDPARGRGAAAAGGAGDRVAGAVVRGRAASG